MALSLSKGQNVSLSKTAPGVTKFSAGLGWDARTTSGDAFDLDAFALLVDANGKVIDEKAFVFFNNPSDTASSVKHSGDNLTGEGDGDDETIDFDLSLVPANVEKVVVAVSIYEAEQRSQTFGQVRNAYVRIMNGATEEVRYDLGEDYSVETAVVFGELYRNGEDWKFRAVGQGYDTGMAGVAKDFGVSL